MALVFFLTDFLINLNREICGHREDEQDCIMRIRLLGSGAQAIIVKCGFVAIRNQNQNQKELFFLSHLVGNGGAIFSFFSFTPLVS